MTATCSIDLLDQLPYNGSVLSLPALSVSRSLRQGLNATPLPLRVLAIFADACNLAADDGRVFALVARKIGDGPLNIVLPGRLPHPLLPAKGAPAWISSERLSLNEIEIDLRCADWEPCPDWAALAARVAIVRARAPVLARLACELAPSPGLLALLGAGQPASPSASRILDIFRQALADLPPGQIWPPDQVGSVAARLAGLGWGLTPAGDDWLAGLLAWAWLAHPDAQAVGAAVVASAAPCTTVLSAAFLRSAAQGECDAAWQDLLAVLASEPPADQEAALRAILAHGATSGADRLAGFLHGCAWR